MKKINDSFSPGQYDTSEVSRRLYRGALDAARRLEEHLHGSPRPDVLGPDVTALRMRLKEYCERLLFCDSTEFSRKAEELLWRKVYYEPLQMFKQHRKKSSVDGAWEGNDLLSGWLRSGVGHYQHLLLRLQAEYQLPLNSILAPSWPWRHRGLRKERWSRHLRSVCVLDREEWATQAAQRCLMCLGDLSRYLSECGDPGSENLSERYYRQAHQLSPSQGMPFNQMGTLAALNPHRGCHALYFYFRCLLSLQPFEGAEGNIQRVFEKNQPFYEELSAKPTSEDKNSNGSLPNVLCIRFLRLAELFYKEQESTNLASLCQDVLQDLESLLSMPEPPDHQITNNVFPDGEEQSVEEHPGLLTFRLGMVALMSFARLHAQGSPLVPAAAAFVLSLMSQVVRHCLIHLQVALLLDEMPLSTATSPSPLTNGTFLTAVDKDAGWTADEDGNRTRSTSGTLTPIAAANGTSPVEVNSTCSREKVKHGGSKRSLIHHGNGPLLLGHLRRRRRRNASSTSQDDSEVSNEEGDLCESDMENGITSDISETGSLHGSEASLTEQEEEDEEEAAGKKMAKIGHPAKTNGEVGSPEECESPESDLNSQIPAQPVLEWWETLQVLQREKFLLALIKVLSHWLSCQPEILAACSQSTHSLWKHFVDLLNVLLKAEKSLLKCQDPFLTRLSPLKCPRPHSTSNNENERTNKDPDINIVAAIKRWNWRGLLPEDIELQLLPFLVSVHGNTTNNNNKIAKTGFQGTLGYTKLNGDRVKQYDQAFGRIQCLVHFGLLQSSPRHRTSNSGYSGKNGFGKAPRTEVQEPLFSFDPDKNCFKIYDPSQDDQNGYAKSVHLSKDSHNEVSADGNDTMNDLEGQRKQLMRNMAHLWLKAEVQDLEGRSNPGRGGKRGGYSGKHGHHHFGGRQGALQGGCLPPYLVPDAGALCHQLPALKQLQGAKRFIIILPSSVVSSLDDLKRQSAHAREAIRWIEAELRAGSRFLRPQKSQERLSLLPMKYPKRKEKEAWDFFQVLECCHYLNKNHSQGGTPSAPLVTLVTGGNQLLPSNAAVVASSAGINMESVEDFLTKWRNSLKS